MTERLRVVSTWADGRGVWHVRVRGDGCGAFGVAFEAIAAELVSRGDATRRAIDEEMSAVLVSDGVDAVGIRFREFRELWPWGEIVRGAAADALEGCE